jgi:cyclic pyranopterin phosphate synthase
MAKASQARLSHLDAAARLRMVDVTRKRRTLRSATAECRVEFPPEAARALHGAKLRSAKGPVLDTAIIAGTQAVKRTHELIPFCHALALEHCRFDCEFLRPELLVIRCTVGLSARTGAEMEALMGASIAALTVYDMCKALSHGIVLRETRLIEKRGGRSGHWRANGP